MMMCTPIHPSFIHPFIHHRHDTGMVLYCNARDGYDRGGFFFLSRSEFIGSNGIATFTFTFVLALAACGPEGMEGGGRRS